MIWAESQSETKEQIAIKKNDFNFFKLIEENFSQKKISSKQTYQLFSFVLNIHLPVEYGWGHSGGQSFGEDVATFLPPKLSGDLRNGPSIHLDSSANKIKRICQEAEKNELQNN